jgi:hypothetical protein
LDNREEDGDRSDFNFIAYKFFPTNCYDIYTQIIYLSNQVFAVLSNCGSRETRRAVLGMVSSLYRACVPVVQCGLNGSTGKMMLPGIKADELPRQAENTSLSVQGTVDDQGNFAPRADDSFNGQRKHFREQDNDQSNKQQRVGTNAIMRTFSRSRGERLLIINRRLLTPDARSHDIHAKAIAECFHPDNHRTHFIRGKTNASCTQFGDLVFIPRSQTRDRTAILTIPGVRGEEKIRTSIPMDIDFDPLIDGDVDQTEIKAMPAKIPTPARVVRMASPTPSLVSRASVVEEKNIAHAIPASPFNPIAAVSPAPVPAVGNHYVRDDSAGEQPTFPIRLSGKVPMVRNPSYIDPRASKSMFRSNPGQLNYRGLDRLSRRPPKRGQPIRANEEDRCYMQYLKRIGYFSNLNIPNVSSERLKAPGLSFNLMKIMKTIYKVQETAYLAVKAIDIWEFEMRVVGHEDISRLFSEESALLAENVYRFCKAMVEHFLCLHYHYALENQTVSLGHVKVKLKDHAFKDHWSNLAGVIRECFVHRATKRIEKKVALAQMKFQELNGEQTVQFNEAEIKNISEDFCNEDAKALRKGVNNWFFVELVGNLYPGIDLPEPVVREEAKFADNDFMDEHRTSLIKRAQRQGIPDETEDTEIVSDEEDFSQCGEYLDGDIDIAEFAIDREVTIEDVVEEKEEVPVRKPVNKKKKKKAESLKNDRVFRKANRTRQEQKTLLEFYKTRNEEEGDVGESTTQLIQQLRIGNREGDKEKEDDEYSYDSFVEDDREVEDEEEEEEPAEEEEAIEFDDGQLEEFAEQVNKKRRNRTRELIDEEGHTDFSFIPKHVGKNN